MTTTASRCEHCGADTPDDRRPVVLGERTITPPLHCQDCENAIEAAAATREAEHEAELRQARFDDRLLRSALPKTFYGKAYTLETLDRDGRADALDAARRFAAGELQGLLLIGPVGVGKSSIAAAAAKRYMLTTGPVRWLPVHQITVQLGLPFDDRGRADTIRALNTTSALTLDDLDKTRPTAYAAEPLFSAIDHAVSDLRPLLVTTNLDLGQLARHWPEPFGVALASRLAGYCETWHLQGTDRRRAARA